MKFYEITFDFIAKHKIPALLLFVLFFILSFKSANRIEINSSIGVMIPQEPYILRSMNYLEGKSSAWDIIIHLRTITDKFLPADLFKYSGEISDRLSKLNFREIKTGFTGENFLSDMKQYMNYLPFIFSEDFEKQVLKKTEYAELKKIISSDYRKLLMPGDLFQKKLISEDPLFFSSFLFDQFKRISLASEFTAILEDGYFLSADKKSTFILIKSNLNILKSDFAGETFEKIRHTLNILPDGIKAEVISPHIHTLMNEKIMKHDMQLALSLDSILFIILIFFVYRDLRALFVFLIPALSIFYALKLTSFAFPRISPLAIGFGSVVAGIAVDYAVHFFSAIKQQPFLKRTDALKKIKTPLFVNYFATASAFLTFYFSKVEGFRQISLFSVFSITLCLIFVIYIFPFLISQKTVRETEDKYLNRYYLKNSRLIVFIWISLLLFSFINIFQIKFKTDITELDGTPLAVKNEEKNFLDIMKSRNLSHVVAEADTFEEALIKNDYFYRNFAAKQQNAFLSVSPLCPSVQTMNSNMKRWNSFRDIHKIKLIDNITEISRKYGFSKNAFRNFFDFLNSDLDVPLSHPEFIKTLTENYIINHNGKYYISTSILNETAADNLSSALKSDPSLFIFSKNQFIDYLSLVSQKEIKFLGLFAITCSLLILILILRNVTFILLSLIPVFTSVTVFFGSLSFLNITVNPLHLTAMVMVIGLTVDYGIFMVHDCFTSGKMHSIKGIFLSSCTTFAGSFVLFFAKHPVLHSLGITIFSGIFTGFITAVLVIPSVYFLIQKIRTEK